MVKKMRQKALAAAVSRDDIIEGAASLGIPLNEPIAHCIAALQEIAAEVDLTPPKAPETEAAGTG